MKSGSGHQDFDVTSVNLHHCHLSEYCDLQGHSVKTFDGVIVDVPSTDCFKVFSRDCSPSKAFLLLTRSTGYTGISKVYTGTVRVVVLKMTQDRTAVNNRTLNAP